MAEKISEPEWRLFKEVREKALERLCERALAEVGRILEGTEESFHKRYLATYRAIQERDKDIAFAFTDLRRSSAVRKLACMQSLNLLTDEELDAFSPETRGSVMFLAELIEL